MELFDKRFVHFMWDDELNGKVCFVSDAIGLLKKYVDNSMKELYGQVRLNNDEFTKDSYPFSFNNGLNTEADGDVWTEYKFAYYDPNYEVKKAFNEGKKIQVHCANGTWRDCDEPKWLDDCMYRVKPDKEKWIAYLARGNDGSCYLSACTDSYWKAVQKEFGAKTKLFIGTHDEVDKWFELRQKFAEVIKAWEDGKPIQIRLNSGEWSDCVVTPVWSCECEYRVAEPEEKKYRPYTSSAEMIADFITRFKVNCPAYATPLIWVRNKKTGYRYLITTFYESTVTINATPTTMCNFRELFELYTFLDRSPVGMEVKE